MPNWKKVIVSGSDAALNSLNVTSQFTASGLHYPTTDGLQFQVIQTDGAGALTFGDTSTIYETIYNGEATTLTKGTVVYVSGSQGANPKVYRANAYDPLKMPVSHVVAENILTASTGRGIILGLLTGVDLTGLGEAGTQLWVDGLGTLTNTRPTGSTDIIQPVAVISKAGNGGRINVLNPGPVLLPNLQTGYTWVGNGSNYPIAIATSSITNVVSSSYATKALSASYAPPSSVFPYTGSARITGSLDVVGPTTLNTTGNTFTLEAQNNDAGSGWVTRFSRPNIANGEFSGILIGAGAYREGFIQYFDNTTPSLIHYGFGIGGDSAAGVAIYKGGRLIINDASTDPTDDGSGNNLQVNGNTSLHGTANIDSNVSITGSLDVVGGITGSLLGTASYASQAGNTAAINVSVFGSDVDSYLLMSNVAGTTGVGIGGDADLRYNASTNKLTVGNISATSLTGSLLGTASYATQALSSSYATTASYWSGSILNATSASYASTASYVLNAISASYAPDTTFPYTGSARITGSLSVTGSISTTSTLNVGGVTTLTGAVTASGIILANNYINISRGTDAYVTNLNVNSGTANTSVFQINTDQPNSKVVLDSRNSYGMSFYTNDVERALLTTSLFQIKVPTTITGSTIVTGSLKVNAFTVAGYGAGNITSNLIVSDTALVVNTTGYSNLAIGANSLVLNTTGYLNTAVGANTLTNNSVGYVNVGIGYALTNNTSGSENIGIGVGAFNNNTLGFYGVAIGRNAVRSNTTGYYNVGIGHSAGYSNINGDGNIYIGYSAGYYATGSNNFYIGNVKQSSEVNDKAYSLMYGTMSGTAASLTGQQLTVNGAFKTNGNTTITGSLIVTNGITGSVAFVSQSYFVQGTLSSTYQAVPQNTDTIIQFADQYDPQNWYDPSTYRFTPTVAGYYNISLGVWFSSFSDQNQQCNIQARINTNTFMILQTQTTNMSSGVSLYGTKIQYFNGSTDYADFTAYQSADASNNIQSGAPAGSGTWFSAIRLNV